VDAGGRLGCRLQNRGERKSGDWHESHEGASPRHAPS
jgi:cbb3-type cytochrome oxidase cytochrome c subunit